MTTPETDMTVDELRTLSQTSQLEGSICAVLGLVLGLLSAGWLLAGRWEGAAGLAAAGLLLAAGNVSFADADDYGSAAARIEPTGGTE